MLFKKNDMFYTIEFTCLNARNDNNLADSSAVTNPNENTINSGFLAVPQFSKVRQLWSLYGFARFRRM